jgi:spore maturation protein CgeB
MRYVQINTFYDQYLRDFYDARPKLKDEPYEHQLRTILDDGFTAVHLMGDYLVPLGFDSHLIIANCPELQVAWAREHGMTEFNKQDWQKTIVRRQLETLKPDIFYICNPIDYDASFMRAVDFKPHVVLGWRGQIIFDWNDFSCFDAILSSEPRTRERALQVGAKAVYHFLPGFPEWIATRVQHEPKLYDVGFCGKITNDHVKRSEVVERVSQYAFETKKFTPTFFINQVNPYPFRYAQQFIHPSQWGIEMHREIKRTKIGLNTVIDFAQGEAGNMRQFEIAGTGTFLLTEFHPQLASQFAIGTEVETYASEEELFEKITYYLAHDAEREAIAKRGQARCFKDHGMGVRVVEFAGILKELLEKKSTAAPLPHQARLGQTATFMSEAEANEIIDTAVRMLQGEQFEQSYKAVEPVLRHYPRMKHAHYVAGMALSQLNRFAESKALLQQELALDPRNEAVQDLIRQLDAELAATGAFVQERGDVLLYGIRDESMIAATLAKLMQASNKNDKVIILIDSQSPEGVPLSDFEKRLNQLITDQGAWSRVVLLRGALERAMNEYRHLLGAVRTIHTTTPALEQELRAMLAQS